MRTVQINRNLILREDGKLFKLRKDVLTGEELIPCISNGYYKVKTFGCSKNVHILVMKYFGTPKPGPEYMIDHIDHNKLNNNINNLRWVTAEGNQQNRIDNLPEGLRRWEFDNYNDYSKAVKKYYRKQKRAGS